MKATIVQNTVVIASDFTPEEINKLKAYKPEALKIKDEKGNVKFAVSFGNTASINENGICFNEVTESGKAAMTIMLIGPETKEEKEAFVKETFGYAMLTANSMSAQITAALKEVEKDFTKMAEQISTVTL